jgi:hypothetical protein
MDNGQGRKEGIKNRKMECFEPYRFTRAKIQSTLIDAQFRIQISLESVSHGYFMENQEEQWLAIN